MKLRIDNLEVEVPPGATVLDAARKLGIDIPTLCHLPGCSPQTSCLVCLVKINGSARLAPSCGTPAAEGMVVESETPEVHSFRRSALELLLAEHTGDCFAPCQSVCPAHMDIPTMMRQIHSGDLRDAIVTVKSAIPLPATLGRICPELCEKGCRRNHLDDAVSICSLKRYVADKDLESAAPYLPPRAAATGKRVAIAGTGPAGLTAAWFLLQQGHAVDLFDDHPLPGGALRYQIGEDRLPRAVLDGEIALVKALGATFIMNVRVGVDPTLAQLRQRYDAVLLAIGPLDRPKAAALGIDFAATGVKIDKKTMMTSHAGIFAAGSALLPLHHAIRAVADGQTVAGNINDFLANRPITGKAASFTSRIGKMNDDELQRFLSGAGQSQRLAPHGGTSQTLGDEEAHLESNRCAHCDCGKLGGCKLRQVAIKYQASPSRHRGARRQFHRIDTHPLIIYEPGKCILCGLCIQIATRAVEPLGLAFVGRGFNVIVSAPMNANLSQALQRAARQCADACPTGAMVLREDAESPESEPTNRNFRMPLPVLSM